MPIYEYKCPVCGDVRERIVISKDAVVAPVCNYRHPATVMERVQFSKTGEPNLIGPGFFKNDYKDKP